MFNIFLKNKPKVSFLNTHTQRKKKLKKIKNQFTKMKTNTVLSFEPHSPRLKSTPLQIYHTSVLFKNFIPKVLWGNTRLCVY